MKKTYFVEKKRHSRLWLIAGISTLLLLAAGYGAYRIHSGGSAGELLSIASNVANAQVQQPDAAPAQAEAPAAAPAATPAAAPTATPGVGPTAASLPSAPATPTATEADDLQKIKNQKALQMDESRIKAMQEEINFKEIKLGEIRTSIAGDLEELKKLQVLIDEKIKEERKLAEQKSDVQMARLIKIVGSMRPENAAALLSESDIDIAVTVLSSLTGAKSSKILGGMAPDKAAKISKRMVTERLTPRMKELTEGWQGLLGESNKNGAKPSSAGGTP